LRWGLVPNWTKEVSPKLKPINATAERVSAQVSPRKIVCLVQRKNTTLRVGT
jgi:putative SOS response-associated peptidase YedK